MHRVEHHFGVPLVDRSKRPFVLTPEGQACYEGFREVLELYDSVEARVRSLRMEISRAGPRGRDLFGRACTT